MSRMGRKESSDFLNINMEISRLDEIATEFPSLSPVASVVGTDSSGSDISSSNWTTATICISIALFILAGTVTTNKQLLTFVYF